MNNSVYLCLSTLEISKIKMYEFLYDYMKPKCGEKVKSYMGTHSFIVDINAKKIYSDIAKCFETRFDTSDYE